MFWGIIIETVIEFTQKKKTNKLKYQNIINYEKL
jgi:hypothetical protein